MTTDTLVPGTDTWLRLLTASKVAAILGASKWDSPRSMWHKMRGDLPREEQTSVQSRGHFLEPAILAWWVDQHDLAMTDVQLQPVFYLGTWAAATPDGVVTHPEHGPVLVEAKSARELEEWGTPGTDEIPAEYLIQAYWQMHVSGIHRCHVPVLGAFLEFAEYVVVYDPEIGAALEAKCLEFVESLRNDVPPDLDGSTATYDALRKVYKQLDDTSVDIDVEVAREYLDALADRKAAEARERLAKATVLDLMGANRYAFAAGVKVARRQANKTGFQLNQVAKSSTELPEGNAA